MKFKCTIEIFVEHYGLLLKCKWVYFTFDLYFAINWHWNLKVMTPLERYSCNTYVQKVILWKKNRLNMYWDIALFVFFDFKQWLPWKQAIFSKWSMMPAWHHSDSWCGRSWDAQSAKTHGGYSRARLTPSAAKLKCPQQPVYLCIHQRKISHSGNRSFIVLQHPPSWYWHKRHN